MSWEPRGGLKLSKTPKQPVDGISNDEGDIIRLSLFF